jgi:hypothetical protein
VRRCHPVWSNDRRIGVAFDDDAFEQGGTQAA